MNVIAFDGYHWIYRAIDVATKLGHSVALKEKESRQTVRAMANVWATFGCPGILQSDNGSEFLGECAALATE